MGLLPKIRIEPVKEMMIKLMLIVAEPSIHETDYTTAETVGDSQSIFDY